MLPVRGATTSWSGGGCGPWPGACHVPARSLGASASARTPRPPAMRAAAATGLYTRVARHHRRRPSALLPSESVTNSRINLGEGQLQATGQQQQQQRWGSHGSGAAEQQGVNRGGDDPGSSSFRNNAKGFINNTRSRSTDHSVDTSGLLTVVMEGGESEKGFVSASAVTQNAAASSFVKSRENETGAHREKADYGKPFAAAAIGAEQGCSDRKEAQQGNVTRPFDDSKPQWGVADGQNGVEEGLPPKKARAMRCCTTSVHGGERGGRPKVSDSLTTPIVQTSTYTFANTAELVAYQEGRYGSFEYGRYGNPTTRACEEKIRALEGAEDCLLSSSGMNSATTLLMALVPAGGHVVTTTDCYRRTRQFIQTVLPKMGVTTTVIAPGDQTALERALEAQPVSLFFSESPTNPYLRVIDIPRVAAACRAAGALVVIDSTFATPCNQQALALGADLVVHSGTKYLGGHNDVLAGAVAGGATAVEAVRRMHNVLGGVIDPHAAYLLLRGMKTLNLRVARQNATAMEVARRLEGHRKVERVHYPGLESHSDHGVAVTQMTGFGGVVSFEIRGDLWTTAAFIDSVRLPYIAPSLGGVESLIEQPTVISYWDQGPEKRASYGIKDNLVRFSCGIEDVEDIWADIEQALECI